MHLGKTDVGKRIGSAVGREGKAKNRLRDMVGLFTGMTESSSDLVDRENGYIIDGNDVSPKIFSFPTAKFGSRRFGLNARDVAAFSVGTGCNIETQSVVITEDRGGDVHELGKRRMGRREGKFLGGTFIFTLGRERTTQGSTKLARMRGRSLQVIHTFIELDVNGSFDTFRLDVPIVNVGHGGGVAEKNTDVDVIVKAMTTATRRTNVHATTKSSKALEVDGEATGTDMGNTPTSMRNEAMDQETKIEGIRPETRVKVGTMEHGSESITDRLVGSLGGSILVGGIRSGRANSVAMLLKKSTHLGMTAEFTAKIHLSILAFRVGRFVLCKPTIEPT